MAKSCIQRVQELEYIDEYRAVVSALAGTYSTIHGSVNAIKAANANFPDPILYAARVEGAPSKIAKNAERLGPSSGDDHGSMAALYEESIKADLDSALADLDNCWGGPAADTFTTEYMSDLGKHLQALSDLCGSLKQAADDIEDRIRQAHDDVVKATREMVREIVGIATFGAAGEGLGAVGGAVAAAAGTISVSTLGIGAIVFTGATAAYIIQRLIVHHGAIESAIDSLNTALGAKLTNALEKISQVKLKRTVSHSVTKAGWNPQETS